MSTRRLAAILLIPPIVKRMFLNIEEPKSNEERLWRERAARMTLDALGHTNLTVKPKRHNYAVRYARRWFRGMYEEHTDPKQVDSAIATFDFAGIDGFTYVRDAVLTVEPQIFHYLDEEDDRPKKG